MFRDRYAWNRVVIQDDLARVTLSLGKEAPGYLRAKQAMARAWEVTSGDISMPAIVAQGRGWITWEGQLTYGVRRLGTWVPDDYDREAEPLLTEFRYFVDEPDEVDATFNIWESTTDDGVLIGWDLEMVGLVTWHRAPSFEKAELWVRLQTIPWVNSDYSIPVTAAPERAASDAA